MNREIKGKIKTIKDFMVIGVGTFINMIVGFLLTPIITRLVDPEHYGNSTLFIMYVEIAIVIVGLGLDQTLVRYYYKESNDLYHKKILFQCIKLPIIICIGIIVAFIIPRILFGNIIFKTSVINIFGYNVDIVTFFLSTTPLLFLLCTLFLLIHRYAMLVLRLQKKSELYSLMNILQKVLFGVFAIIFILYISYGTNYDKLIISTTISYMIVAFVAILLTRKAWNFIGINKFKLPFPKIELYKYGIPLIFSSCVARLLQACSSTMLKVLSDNETVGIYASAINLVHIFGIIQITFNTIWAPMMVEHYETNKEDKKYYVKVNQIITYVLFLFGAIMLLCKDIFIILLGDEYREAAFILPFLMFYPIMYTMSETTNCGIVFMNKSKLNIWVSACALISDFVVCLLLIPKFGVIGAAIATAVGYTVFFFVRTIIGYRYYLIDFKIRKLLIVMVLFTLYCLYSCFNNFDLVILIAFIVFCVVLTLMYKDIVVEIAGFIKEFINSKKKHNKD